MTASHILTTEEMQLEEDVLEYARERGLTETQTNAFKEVFDMLDLDGGGILTDRELKIGQLKVLLLSQNFFFLLLISVKNYMTLIYAFLFFQL